MIKRTLLLIAAASLAGVAHAQGFRGNAAMMRMFQSGPMASATMLGREDVQAEIKLSDEQKGKIDAQRAASRDKMRSAFMEMRNNAGGSPEDMQKTMQTKIQALFEDMSKEALAVLDEAQKKRVAELAIQSQGSLAVLRPDVSKALSITAAQKAKIEDLQRLQDEANAGLFERVQNHEMERDEMDTAREKNSKVMDAEVVKILTSAQRDKLKALGGVPFEFKDPKPGTPGSFGRPGGGREATR